MLYALCYMIWNKNDMNGGNEKIIDFRQKEF